MAEQIEWSVTHKDADANNPPPGLECIVDPCSCHHVVLYLSNLVEPDKEIVAEDHVDVLSSSFRVGKRHAALLVKVLRSTFLGPDWRLDLEYEPEAIVGGELHQSVIQGAECYTAEVANKLDAESSNNASETGSYRDGVASEDISGHRCVFWEAGSGVALADAASNEPCQGVVRDAASSGNTVRVYGDGEVSGFSGLTPGSYYYRGSNGLISDTPHANNYQRIGHAITETVLLIDIEQPVTIQ